MKSVREQVSEALAAINLNHKSLRAVESTEYAMVLASLLSRVLEEEADAEGICAMYKVTLMEEGQSNAQATEKMKATQEWKSWQGIKAMRIGVTETIKVLKKRVEAVTHEEQANTWNK